MFPIALNLKNIPVLLVGSGELLHRRQTQLREAGAQIIAIFEDEIPTEQDIKNATIIMVAGLPREVAEPIAIAARAAGKLVNVEDINDLCDFYFTANVRRGDLLIAVSTGGASPTLARKIRDYIGNRFGEHWGEHTKEISQHRLGLKAQGKTMKEVLAESEAFLAQKGWLSCTRCPKEKDSA